jgi:uncharacterized protein (DUF1501 family)
MESGTPGVKSTPDGWLGRAAAALPPSRSPFRAVALAPALPRTLRGDGGALAMASIDRFDVRADGGGARRGFESLYEQSVRDVLHGTGRETFEAVKMLRSADAARLAPAHGAEYPHSRFGESMRQIAALHARMTAGSMFRRPQAMTDAERQEIMRQIAALEKQLMAL